MAEKSGPGANLALTHDEADLTTLIMLLVGQSRHSAQLFCPLIAFSRFGITYGTWNME